MKKLMTAGIVLCALFLTTINVNAQRPANQVVFADSTYSLTYPLEIATIIDNKCYGCHSPNSRNKKAKENFTWIGLQTMEAIDLVGFIEEVHEVLEERSMPPAKMLEKFPEAKLTDEEVATLKAWADAVGSKLMNE